MINFFHFKEFGDGYLLTNDFGRYAFIKANELSDLVNGHLDLDSPIGRILVSGGFVYEGSDIDFVLRHSPFLRGIKEPLFSPTTLHIFVVTTGCNLDCVYCQAHSEGNKAGALMDARTMERAIDIALCSPAPLLTFEFQGGEPLLNYPTIRHAVEYTETIRGSKEVQYSVVSNLTLITDEMIDFFRLHNVGISTSLDGPPMLHDANRPYKSLGSTYTDVIRGIERVREAGLAISAIQTTTRMSLDYAAEIVDTYCKLGFKSVFIRPLTPLGIANTSWSRIGYTPKEFGKFYREAISAILEKNKQGFAMREGHASMLLEKLFTGIASNYMEQRSPCGASVGQMAYHVNGDVFTCDEGRMLYEMGDTSFKLGTVDDTYTDLIRSTTCHTTCAASTVESLPSCCDCVYSPYCGICPVVNLALEADVVSKQPNNYRCAVYSEMFDTVFSLLYNNDEMTSVLGGWIG